MDSNNYYDISGQSSDISSNYSVNDSLITQVSSLDTNTLNHSLDNNESCSSPELNISNDNYLITNTYSQTSNNRMKEFNRNIFCTPTKVKKSPYLNSPINSNSPGSSNFSSYLNNERFCNHKISLRTRYDQDSADNMIDIVQSNKALSELESELVNSKQSKNRDPLFESTKNNINRIEASFGNNFSDIQCKNHLKSNIIKENLVDTHKQGFNYEIKNSCNNVLGTPTKYKKSPYLNSPKNDISPKNSLINFNSNNQEHIGTKKISSKFMYNNDFEENYSYDSNLKQTKSDMALSYKPTYLEKEWNKYAEGNNRNPYLECKQNNNIVNAPSSKDFNHTQSQPNENLYLNIANLNKVKSTTLNASPLKDTVLLDITSKRTPSMKYPSLSNQAVDSSNCLHKKSNITKINNNNNEPSSLIVKNEPSIKPFFEIPLIESSNILPTKNTVKKNENRDLISSSLKNKACIKQPFFDIPSISSTNSSNIKSTIAKCSNEDLKSLSPKSKACIKPPFFDIPSIPSTNNLHIKNIIQNNNTDLVVSPKNKAQQFFDIPHISNNPLIIPHSSNNLNIKNCISRINDYDVSSSFITNSSLFSDDEKIVFSDDNFALIETFSNAGDSISANYAFINSSICSGLSNLDLEHLSFRRDLKTPDELTSQCFNAYDGFNNKSLEESNLHYDEVVPLHSSKLILDKEYQFKNNLSALDFKLDKPRNIVTNNLPSKDLHVIEMVGNLTNAELRDELLKVGVQCGPVCSSTRQTLEQKLVNILGMDINNKNLEPEFCSELNEVFSSGFDKDRLEELEKKAFDVFLDTSVAWVHGKLKHSFIYMLIDPIVSLDLPSRYLQLGEAKAFKIFVKSIFYVGKGKSSRPYNHLREAAEYFLDSKKVVAKGNVNKIKRIVEIWSAGLGLVIFMVFHNILAVDAYTREACIIETIGLKNLTNACKGQFHGPAASFPPKNIKKLGAFLLRRCFLIYCQEGERQIKLKDLRNI